MVLYSSQGGCQARLNQAGLRIQTCIRAHFMQYTRFWADAYTDHSSPQDPNGQGSILIDTEFRVLIRIRRTDH